MEKRFRAYTELLECTDNGKMCVCNMAVKIITEMYGGDSQIISQDSVFGLVIHGRACIFLLIVWALSFRSGRLSVSIVAKER